MNEKATYEERLVRIRALLRLPRDGWPREEPHASLAWLLDQLEIATRPSAYSGVVKKGCTTCASHVPDHAPGDRDCKDDRVYVRENPRCVAPDWPFWKPTNPPSPTPPADLLAVVRLAEIHKWACYLWNVEGSFYIGQNYPQLWRKLTRMASLDTLHPQRVRVIDGVASKALYGPSAHAIWIDESLEPGTTVKVLIPETTDGE